MQITPEILEKYLEDHYSGRIDKSNPDEWILPSLENERKMKLYVNIKKGVGHDFIGGRGYTAFYLIKELEGFETNRETEKFILDCLRFRVNVKDRLFKKESKKEELPPITHEIPLPDGSISILSSDPVAQECLQYMLNRGLSRKDCEKYHLHVGTKEKYRWRIIIPFIENGKMLWYQGRSIKPVVNPKYLNPKGVDKKMLVFNIDNVENLALVTEGPIDAMMVNGVALGGSRASDWQVNKIISKKPDGIVVIPDNDETKVLKGKKINAGYQGAAATIESFIKAGYPVNQIFVAFIKGGKDLNEIGKSKAIECINSAVPLNTKTLVQLRQKGVDIEFLSKHI